MTVFDRFKGYGFVHHRSLNSPQGLRYGLALASLYPERTHVLEGDVCWDFSGSNELFYFRHPSVVIDTLPTATVRRRLRERTLVGLQDLVDVKGRRCFLALELKVGRGDWRKALANLVEHLEVTFAGRYWIDGFSLPMLQFVKEISPETPVTLHTECVCRERVLVAAPEWPAIRVRHLADLAGIDGVAVRWRGGERFMARASEQVTAAGKVLILSRLHHLRQFACSKHWGAKAGYMHWGFKELLVYNDQIDLRRGLPATG